MFRVGDLESTLTIDRTPFQAGLQAARSEAQRFEREGITAKVDLDAANAERRLAQVGRDRTINADLDLDTGAAEAKLLLLQRQAASIGGGGVGGVGGSGGGGGGILGPGGFFRPSPLLAAGAVGASFLPTIGASAVQGALGAGALGLGGAAAAGVGGAGILATARPAVTALGNVTTAQQNLNKAVATYGRNSAQAKTATSELRAAQSLLPKSGQQVASSLQDIQSRWSRLSMPAQNQFFGMLHDGLTEAEKLLPGFARSADTSMGAARGAFDHFLGIFNTPDFHTFENTMTMTFAQGIGPLEAGIENIGHVLERIAVASAPDVLRMLHGFQDVTHGWEQNTRNAGELQHHVHETVQQFGNWFDLATSLGHLLSALFITNQEGARKGGQEVEAVTHQLDQWARWIEHHHHDITHFFGQLNDDVGLLLSSSGQIASVVLPAFRPVADIIHEIVTDLNSIKVGNVSALTVLLGFMAARGIGSKLGLVGAGAAAGGGLTAAEAGGAGAATGIGARIGAAALARLPTLAGGAAMGAGSAVLFQSLAGKPGTFLGPGIAGLVPDAGEFTRRIHRDLAIQRDYHHKSLAQLEALRGQVQQQWRGMWETDPAAAQSAGAESMVRAAHRTARQLSDQIDAMNLGQQMADAVGSGRGDVRSILKDYEQRFEALPPTVQDAAVKSAKQELDALRDMGLITKRQERQTLGDLEDMQAQSLRKQRAKWDQFGQNVNHIVGHWFGNMAGTVNTILGNKGITGMVNQLLTGVGSQHDLKWNATTAGRVAGTLAGFLNIGGAAGGFIPGYSTTDNFPIAVRGGEAILRPEDHVPIVSRALQHTYGFGLGDLFNRTGAKVKGYSDGGFVDLWGKGMQHFAKGGVAPPPGGWSGMTPEIIALAQRMVQNFGGSLSSGLRPGDPGFHGRGMAVDWVGGDWGGGTRYANQIGPQLLEGIHQGPPGSNVSWDSGHQVPPSFWTAPVWAQHVSHVHLAVSQMVAKAMQQLIPHILVHGPHGAIRNGLQGIADMGRMEANRYLRRHMRTPVTDVTAHGAGVLSEAEFLAVARRAMGVTGHREFSPGGLLSLALQESGLRVNPPPPHDINWPNNPSMGLMQVTEDTFRAYHEPGTSSNIVDPLANIAASINYQVGRYGHQITFSPYGNGGRLGAGELGIVGERGTPELIAGRHDGGADIIAPGTLRKIQGRPVIQVHVHIAPGSGAAEWRDRVHSVVDEAMDEYGSLDGALARAR